MVLIDGSGNKKEVIAPANSAPKSLSLPRSQNVSLPPSATPASLPDCPSLREIIMKQRAAGNFSEDVLACIGKITVADLHTNIPNAIANQSSALDQVLIASFVCGVLRSKYAAYEDQWTLVEKKAQNWIKKNYVGGDTLDWISLSILLAHNVSKA